MKGQRKSSDPSTASVVPLRPAEPTSAEMAIQVQAELDAARQDLETARADLSAAKVAYGAAADAARLSDAMAASAQAAEAAVVVDIGQRLVTRLEAELATHLAGARDAAAAVARETAQASAELALKEYETAFLDRMPSITAGLRGLIRLWAKAELAREEAAAHGVKLPAADDFRHVLGGPRVDISRRELDLWINPSSNEPFGDADQKLITQRASGIGVLSSGTYLHEATEKRRYVEITYHPFSMGVISPTLIEAMLPCIRAGGPAGWSPLGSVSLPKDVLSTLDTLEARQCAPVSTREVKVERKAIELARDMRVNPKPAPFHKYQGAYSRDVVE